MSAKRRQPILAVKSPEPESPKAAPARRGAQQFIERTIGRLARLEQDAELAEIFPRLLDALPPKGREHALALMALHGDPEMVAAIVRACADIGGYPDTDATYEAEAALIRLGVAPHDARRAVATACESAKEADRG